MHGQGKCRIIPFPLFNHHFNTLLFVTMWQPCGLLTLFGISNLIRCLVFVYSNNAVRCCNWRKAASKLFNITPKPNFSFARIAATFRKHQLTTFSLTSAGVTKRTLGLLATPICTLSI